MARNFLFANAVLLGAALFGCADKQAAMDMSGAMPERPEELALLDPMIGKWSYDIEMTTPESDKPMKGTGTSEATWEADKWVMIERMKGDIPELGTMYGVSVWAWDPDEKAFRTWWHDSFGGVAYGTARYNAADKTWRTEGKSRSMETGRWTPSEGKMKFVGADTVEWSGVEWADAWKTKKSYDMKGTSTRMR